MRQWLRTSAREELSHKIYSWLAAPDPSSNLNATREKRQQDTGLWLLNDQVFLDWKSAPCSFLWLHGKARSGKTILSSTAIQPLLNEEMHKTVTYFYFDFQTREKQLFRSSLCSILSQLFHHDDETFRILENLYNVHSHGSIRPTVQDLESTLRRMFGHIHEVYLVIDALDECEDRDSLLEGLENLRSWGQKNLHVFATSRLETDIEDTMITVATANIPLEESVVDGDILSYIRDELRHDKRLSKWSDDIRVEIETVLLEGANGMFRWVVCQLDAIRRCLKLGLLRKTLRSLPKTLDETYARIMDRIPDEHVADVHRVLCCLICSFEPLAIQEVAGIVAITTEGDPYYNVEDQLSEPRAVLAICSGLVSTTRSSRRNHLARKPPWNFEIQERRLAHFSIKEYLVSGRVSSTKFSNFAFRERSAHETLAELLLCYLLQEHKDTYQNPQTWSNDGDLLGSEFAPCAASFWSCHLREAQLDSSSPFYCRSLQMIMDSERLIGIIRLRGMWSGLYALNRMFQCTISIEGHKDQLYDAPTDLRGVAVGDVPAIYYASLLGADQLVSMLLVAGENINSSGPEGTCLAAAAFCGHLSTAELLLKNGAEINAVIVQSKEGIQICQSLTAIHCAIEGQQEAMAKFLISKGADVNIRRSPSDSIRVRGVGYGTPLHKAASIGNYNLVRLLKSAGADADASGGLLQSALDFVCESRQLNSQHGTETMKILPEAGADPNRSNKRSPIYSPLADAIVERHTQPTELLIRYGADLEILDENILGRFNYLLYDGIEYIAAMQLLIYLRPNLNYVLPLISVSKLRYGRALIFMLQHGVQPDHQDYNGIAPIHAAAFLPAYNLDMIKDLLDAHADVNIHGGPFGSALQAAALSGNAQVVQRLLENGALVNHTGGEYGTALRIAQDRLEDQKRGWPEIWNGDVNYYGPKNNLRYTRQPDSATGFEAPGPRTYPDRDIQLPAHANFQAVVDLLEPLGAIAGPGAVVDVSDN